MFWFEVLGIRKIKIHLLLDFEHVFGTWDEDDEEWILLWKVKVFLVFFLAETNNVNSDGLWSLKIN